MLSCTGKRSHRHTILHVSFSNSFGLASARPTPQGLSGAPILQEANKPQVPLLERLSFLGIYSNNLDEFFRVRVALLNRIAECDDRETRDERHDAIDTLKVINKLNAQYSKEYENAIHQVTDELRNENICLVNDAEIDEEQREFVRNFYYKQLDGYISPVWFSALKDLNNEPDNSIYVAVKMRRESDKSHPEYALLPQL